MTGKDEKEKSECSESSGFTKISQLNLFKKEDLSGPPFSAHPHQYKRKLSRKANPAEGNMVLQPDIYDTEETGRPPTFSRPPETKSACEKTEILDGDADIHLQMDRSKGLPDVTRPPGCFHAHLVLQAIQKVPPISFKRPLIPVPSIAIGAIAEPVRHHEDPPHSSRMDQIERNSSLGIPRISDDYGTQISSSASIELMDIDSDVDETGNPEPFLLEEPANVL
ncbi:hypothetical protein AYI70_g7674 [Smittium culicis]|uniref:Uncharacterized protein n=1 Tax=Smittium culicis TaxID=133412 RepID=A0A1R1XJH5_9FUNG|nr:hypothetical protein AYI70_g7674 [Smittium culicis]